jgi:hypothetical protein
MFVLMSHRITLSQQEDAHESFGIDAFEVINNPIWSNIPADEPMIEPYLDTIKQTILNNAKQNDLLFVQGDFGATVAMVSFAKQHGLIPVYATTDRVARDIIEGDKIITVREFKHVRFREYEGI